MITCGLASQTAIKSAIWLRGHRGSLPCCGHGFSFVLPSTSRKLFHMTATIDGKDKDPLYNYQALPVIEITNEDDLETQLMKNVNTLDLATPSPVDLIISNPMAHVTPKTSRKEGKNLTSIANQSQQIQVFRYLLGTESAMKAILEDNTLVFVVDKRADKNIIKENFTKMFKIMAKKVNTSITPDGTKKAFIMLPSNIKALDVAKTIKIL